MPALALSPEELLGARLRAQGLAARADSDAVSAARRVVGTQAQDPAAGVLALRARSRGLTAAAVADARAEGRLARTWTVRGTLHLVPREDLGWLRAALAPAFLPRARRWLERRGVAARAQAALGLVSAILGEEGPLTRDELIARLAERGHPELAPARAGLVQLAALEGLVVGAAERGREPTWARLEPQAPPGRDAALACLARRYLEGFGPADAADLAAWSGLPARDARAGLAALEDELVRVRALDRALLALPGALEPPVVPAAPLVTLLPAFDTYLLGWADRALTLPATHAKRIFPGGGILHSAVLLDGRTVGRWRLGVRRGRLQVTVAPFLPLPPGAEAPLRAEVGDLGRFLGLEADLVSAEERPSRL